MIFVLIAVTLVLAIAGFVICNIFDSEGALFLGVLSTVGLGVSIIAAIVLAVNCSSLRTIDSKIAMYEEENTRIETQIDAAVKAYIEHEKEIMTKAAPDAAPGSETSVVLVAAYPELASNMLVQEQLRVYTSNNEKIKELKEAKINGAVMRWWLYFKSF